MLLGLKLQDLGFYLPSLGLVMVCIETGGVPPESAKLRDGE
jgi:hypothetical protein